MLVIALTGGIGSGKTTVSDIFKSKNIPVIDTDIIARDVINKDKPAYKEIVKLFGAQILDKDKNINRQELRNQIFNSERKRKQLENILHPLIWGEVNSSITSLKASSSNIPYCIIVVPLLFENKQEHIKFDRILVIDAPESLQIKRTMQRDNCDEQQVKSILKTQVSRQTRIESADDIILNTEDRDSLNADIDKLHQQYLKLSK